MAYNEIGHEYVEVIGSASKTHAQVLTELYNQIDWSKINPGTTYFMYSSSIYRLEITDGSETLAFVLATTNFNAFYINRMIMTPTAKQAISRTNTTASDISGTTTAGSAFRICYR